MVICALCTVKPEIKKFVKLKSQKNFTFFISDSEVLGV